MTKKIFRAVMLVALVILVSSLALVFGCLYEYFGGVQERQLADELALAATAVEEYGEGYLEKLRQNRCRVTLIAADGAVLFDTQTDAGAMENHADREEIKQALQSGAGNSIRYSPTLSEMTIYSAKRLSGGSILRLSASRATLGALLHDMIWPALAVLSAALLLSWLLARRLARRIVAPLNALNLDQPLENDTYEELSPLLSRLNRQQTEMALQLRQLRRQRDEFAQITENMKEGLVLLDGKGAIISINPAARRLFSVDESCVDGDFMKVERSRDVSLAIDAALLDGHSEAHVDRGGQRFRLDISRIESEGAVVGAVLLAFDISALEFAERNRREFTANVSHELKTPLQSIIGSAELLENNLVKPADIPRFVGHIKQEASRLVTLIEDILRLSQLDEGGELPAETIDLLALSSEVAASLADAAKRKNVSVQVRGEAVSLRGVRRLLYEVVYNLCDNAIKYNVEGGRVEVTVFADGKNAAVTVGDSGIGIPKDQQSRVFERFYRVDRSHSKASGGTGLGLSIVKHAVQYHHGEIRLYSNPGEGTEITVTLPRQ